MELKNILLIVFGIILLLLIFNKIRSEMSSLTALTSAETAQTIAATSLATSSTELGTSNFTYSIWFYIDDWNYKYGEPKILFGRTSGLGENCPSVVLGSHQNNLAISLACYNGDDTSSSSIQNITTVENIPVQKWVSLIVSVYGRSIDVYIDGKLVRTDILPGLAKVDSSAPLFITPNGGFSGWTNKFQYYPKSLNPQEAWNIYRKGNGQSWISNLFGSYSLKVSIVNNDNEKTSITL